MYNHQNSNALFVVLLGAVLFVLAQLPNSIVVNHEFFHQAHATTVKRIPVSEATPVASTSARVSYDIPEESWEDNIVITLPEGNDVMTANWSELECLAVNIYHEARGEPELGQELVAQVVVNRMNKKWWPDTACGVVRQTKQFSWTHDGRSDQVTDVEAYRQAYLIAIEYLYMGKKANLPHAEQIVNYHNTSVSPRWTNMVQVMKVGDHQFYRPTYYLTRA